MTITLLETRLTDDVDINTLTIYQYMALIRDDIRPGVVKPKIGNDVEFEINSNFIRGLRRKIFAGSDDEDAHEHLSRVLEILDLFHFFDITHDVMSASRSELPIEDHSHNRYDETTTKEKIKYSPDNIDAIQESFKEAHLTKERPLKKEDKAVEQRPVHDKEKIVRKVEHDYDIPPHGDVVPAARRQISRPSRPVIMW
nr:hypothetical protein [Tanacetum cinerariifolium]